MLNNQLNNSPEGNEMNYIPLGLWNRRILFLINIELVQNFMGYIRFRFRNKLEKVYNY